MKAAEPLHIRNGGPYATTFEGTSGVRSVNRPFASRPLASRPLASRPLASRPLASRTCSGSWVVGSRVVGSRVVGSRVVGLRVVGARVDWQIPGERLERQHVLFQNNYISFFFKTARVDAQGAHPVRAQSFFFIACSKGETLLNFFLGVFGPCVTACDVGVCVSQPNSKRCAPRTTLRCEERSAAKPLRKVSFKPTASIMGARLWLPLVFARGGVGRQAPRDSLRGGNKCPGSQESLLKQRTAQHWQTVCIEQQSL